LLILCFLLCNTGLTQEAVDFVDEYCDGKINIYLNKAFMKLRRDGGNDKNNQAAKLFRGNSYFTI